MEYRGEVRRRQRGDRCQSAVASNLPALSPDSNPRRRPATRRGGKGKWQKEKCRSSSFPRIFFSIPIPANVFLSKTLLAFVADQAALRAASAGDACEGRDRMADAVSSSLQRSESAAWERERLRFRQAKAARPMVPAPRRARVAGSGTGARFKAKIVPMPFAPPP